MNKENKALLENLTEILNKFDDTTVSHILSGLYDKMLAEERTYHSNKNCKKCKYKKQEIAGSNGVYGTCVHPEDDYNHLIYDNKQASECKYFKDSSEETIYPLTIIEDRYTGTYSGGVFTAWNLNPHEIPAEAWDSDNECFDFWSENKIPVGKGSTIMEAYLDLVRILKEKNQ